MLRDWVLACARSRDPPVTRIIVCPLHDVDALIAIQRPSHIVSLMSPSARLDIDMSGHKADHLVLRFNDIAEPCKGLIAPNENHIRKYLDFLQSWDSTQPLLVHCWAGVSRSPAAAYIAMVQSQPEMTELDIARHLRAKAPYATPNRRIIEIADTLLAKSDRMSAAIADIGRGSDTAWGSSFSLSGR